jgi:FkbM family methyltransferase
MTSTNLVFDLGFHRGEDTDHYLALGHRVVAVEANPSLAEDGRQRFAAEISSGQLQLIHAAVVGQGRGLEQVNFHPHPSRSEWGSVDLRWVRRNAEAHQLPHNQPIAVAATSLPALVAEHGCPWLLKIDIEGADEEVLADLSTLEQLPAYVSWETGKESLRAVIRQHRRLAEIGYGRFRIVQQAYLEQRAAVPLADGQLYRFSPGTSGPSPANCPQPWRSLGWVVLQYRLLFLLYALIGPGSAFVRASRSRRGWLAWLPRRLRRWAERRAIPFPGWVDSHAALGRAGLGAHQ